MDDANTQARIKAMREAYAAKLPEKISDLEETWNALSNDNWELSLTTLHRQAHTLAGSSGMFGYEDPSKAARALELDVEKIMEGGGPPTLEQRDHIAQLLVSLKKSVQLVTLMLG